jgi:hypothetical protein
VSVYPSPEQSAPSSLPITSTGSHAGRKDLYAFIDIKQNLCSLNAPLKLRSQLRCQEFRKEPAYGEVNYGRRISRSHQVCRLRFDPLCPLRFERLWN